MLSDSFITVVIIIITGVLLFAVPMVTIAHRTDVIATQAVQAAISEFLDTTRKTGEITSYNYNTLLSKVEATRRKL